MCPEARMCAKWNFFDSCQMAWFKFRIKVAVKRGDTVLFSSLKARPNVIKQFERMGYRIVTVETMIESWTWISW